MTAEQLEELANGFAEHLHSEETVQSLASRVLAAEAMAVELEKCEIMLRERGLLAQADASEAALAAYREASK